MNIVHRSPQPSEQPVLSDREQRVWDALASLSADETPVHIDALARAVEFSSGETLNILLSLEIKGHVEQLPGMHFRQKNKKERYVKTSLLSYHAAVF